MSGYPTVTIDQMRPQLLTLDQARERLGHTEPLAVHTFPVSEHVSFTVTDGWQEATDHEIIDAHLVTSEPGPQAKQYQLTKAALLEAGAQVGIPRKAAQRWPTDKYLGLINWWFQEGAGDKTFKLLYKHGTDNVLALARGTITPYSNLALLDTIVGRIQARYGMETEILVDYKAHHDVERTNMRLVVPEASRVIDGTRIKDDVWSPGIDFANSLVGIHRTDVAGYLFRWWCTNGATDTLAVSEKFNRRSRTADDDVYEWAARAVDDALSGLENAWEGIQQLTTMSIPEDAITQTMKDLFARARPSIPKREQARVIEALADLTGNITMYDLQQAITQTANADGLAARAVEALVLMGGQVAHAGTGRCEACHRLLPDDMVQAVAHVASHSHVQDDPSLS